MERQSESTNHQTLAMKVAKISLIFEFILTVFKLYAGAIGHSAAMLSDAVHSASDVLSTIVVMVGVKMSAKEADKEHPYGHERMESVAANILAIFLGITGACIGYNGIKVIFSGEYNAIALPGKIALIAAIISIVTKEAMYWYARFYAKRIRSSALMADAWHHRSDAMSSIGSLIGIAGARMGCLILEPIACVVISLFIIKVAIQIFRDSINEMTDHCCESELEIAIRTLVLQQEGVLGIDSARTRKFGNKIYVEIDLFADPSISLDEANHIAKLVHDVVEEAFVTVKHISVRLLPESDEMIDS